MALCRWHVRIALCVRMTTMWLLSPFVIVLSFARINVADGDNLFIFPNAPGPNHNYIGDLSWSIGSSQNIQ